MIKEVTAWHEKHLKPVVVTEYGAGALAGLHTVTEWQRSGTLEMNVLCMFDSGSSCCLDRGLSSGLDGAEL